MKMKKILVILLTLFLVGMTHVNAATPKLCDRNALDNNGVNKKWKITSTNKDNVMNTPCVNAADKIYDFEGVLTDEEIQQLQVKIGEYIERTHMDLVIVIKNLPYSYDKQNEDYAADFYDYNDFGIDTKNYDGTLLLRNTYEKDPYYDVYTFGEAQLVYNYDSLQVILDGIYDDLHAHRYYDGFSKYIDYLERYFDDESSRSKSKDYELDENGFLRKKYTYPFVVIFIMSFVITLIIIIIMVSKNKMVKKAVSASAYIDKANAKITKREDTFVATHTSSYTTSSSSSGGHGGGFHSSGGSSGGGHSSGGGRHG